MCGIFTLVNINYSKLSVSTIHESFLKGKSRGPDNSNTKYFLNSFCGFHRLAINGLSDLSNQPIEIDNIFLYCNGEIFNYKELYSLIDISPRTGSDCEIIIHLYKKFGIEYTLQLLDGEFAFVLLDTRLTNKNIDNFIHIARDPFGVRPLFTIPSLNSKQMISFASEVKMLSDLNGAISKNTIRQFSPGCYTTLKLGMEVNSIWKIAVNQKSFYRYPLCSLKCDDITSPILLSTYLETAIVKRCDNSERPIACLLSGGLDSSTVTAITNNYLISQGKKLKTFSIGLKDSEDLSYAREVAYYLDTDHMECIIDESNLLSTIKDVIYAIESYDTTTIRASIGNYLIGKFIRENSDCKVILNGDGADELFGGYLYFNNYKNDIEFDKEIKHLLSNIHYFDGLRSDRCISSNGLEARTPFLDSRLVDYYLSLPLKLRNHNNKGGMEKQLLRDTVNSMFNSKGEKLLPKEIIYRKKEAFSDGVSSKKRSFFTIIQESIQKEMNYTDISGVDIEKRYYKFLFNEFFYNCNKVIPYLWMPKFSQTDDPSARLLDIYKKNEPEMKRWTEEDILSIIEPITEI